MPAVSVIIPIYKAGNTLSRCLDSVLSQTLLDLEIILINDGSPDNSGKICNEYQKKDARIKVIHKKNEGVSTARQCGIDIATGEYTIHVDADDWIATDMIENLYNKAKSDNADMVICDYFNCGRAGKRYTKQAPTNLKPYQVIFDLCKGALHGSLCNKLIRSAIYKEHMICFPAELSIMEDKVFVIQSCYFMNKISYLNRAFYYYDTTNILSITHRPIPPIKFTKAYDYLSLFFATNNVKDKTLLKALRLFQISTLSYVALYGDNCNHHINYKQYFKLLPYIHTHKTLALSHKLALYLRILGLSPLVQVMLFYKKNILRNGKER